MKEEPTIEKAEKVLKYLGTNEEIIRDYELREKAVHDEITRITGAHQEGLEEGIKEGIKEGIEKGRQEEKLETARNMLVECIDIELIEKFTGLSKETIGLIRKK